MGPLEGLVVVDASWGMVGSITSLLLADNGAEVIKVERPGTEPDPLIRLAWERGKQSVELDVRDPAEREALLNLISGADIFIEAFGPGRGEALGLDYETLKARFPRLIHCAITGYGRDTPWRDEPAWDCLVAARLGLMSEQASVGRKGPIFLGHPHIGYGTAFIATISTLAAVRARRITGRGQLVDVSMLNGVLAQSPMNWWYHPASLSYVELSEGKRVGFGRKRLITGAFECEDGEFLQVHTGGQGGFRNVMEVFGFGDITQTVTSGSDMSVPLSDEEMVIARDYIPEAFKLKPRAEWVEAFEARDVACLPVLRQGEVLQDAQVRHAGRASEVQHPTLGTLLQAAPPLTFARSPLTAPAPAPKVGQDNAAVRARMAAAAPGAGEAGSAPLRHALQGITVLDFSAFFATAYGAKLLSDLGADVIQIEAPGGDQMRPLPNPFEACQRGKRNIVLDLKTAEGRAVAHRLAARADVVMHNQRPGKAEKIGLDYQTLSAINPKLVYCYLPGFGSTGPKSLRKSFAPLQSGFTGLLYEGAGAGNKPVRAVEGNEDYYNGLMGASAVLMGLEHRARTGQGQLIESPQLHSSLFVSTHHFLGEGGRSMTALPLDHEQMGRGPLYRLYQTLDDWICIACVGETKFQALAGALGLPAEMAGWNAAARAGQAEALQAALAERFAERTSQAVHDLLRAAGVACEIPAKSAVVPTLFFEDWALQTDRVYIQDQSLHGPIREVGLCMSLSDTPGEKKGAAPRLGQHSRQILAELGYGAEDIGRMIASGAVFAEAAGAQSKLRSGEIT